MKISLMRVFVLFLLSIYIFQSSPTNANLVNETLVPAESIADLYEYDGAIETSSWEPVSLIPEPLGYFGMSQVNGDIYTFGGTNWDRYPLSSDIVKKYDPNANIWQDISIFPEPVVQKVISVGEKIYIFGGEKIDENFNHFTLSSTWEYDTSTNFWVQKSDLPSPRMSNGVAYLNKKFFVIGGSTSESSNYTDTIFIYDPILDSWSEGAPMPTARLRLSAIAANGKIYAFGGWADGGLSVVEAYDPLTDSWSTKSNMPISRWVDGNEVIENNGKIYFVGGCTGDYNCTMLSRVDVYDVETDTWSSLPDLPFARTGGGVTIVDGILYSIGGYNYGTFYDSVYAYNLDEKLPSWLLMYYMAGDNNLDEALLVYESGSIISNRNSNVDIAIFTDSRALNTSYRFYPAIGTEEYVYQGNLNSGDGQTLVDFMGWAKSKSTAPNQALIITDHGHGLSGVAWDDNADSDYISVDGELREALISSGPVDVLFNHNCLTGNFEFMWELRGLTDYYIASESISWGPFLHDYLRGINLETTAEELSRNIAESYYSKWNKENSPSTISVINMSHIQDIFEKTNNLALAIMNAPLETKSTVYFILTGSNLQRFDERDPGGISSYDRLADLYHFASLVNYLPELSSYATPLLDTKNNFVIYNQPWSGYPKENVYWDHTNANGVAISLPTNPISFYIGDWLDFATGADWSFLNPTIQSTTLTDGYYWGPMISDLILLNNPEGDDDPLPPDLVSPGIMYDIYLPLIMNGSPCSNAPTLLEPANGANLDNLIPLFRWNNGDDPNATELHLEVARDSGFTQYVTSLWSSGSGGGYKNFVFPVILMLQRPFIGGLI